MKSDTFNGLALELILQMYLFFIYPSKQKSALDGNNSYAIKLPF